jgi:serine/threonine protein kinase
MPATATRVAAAGSGSEQQPNAAHELQPSNNNKKSWWHDGLALKTIQFVQKDVATVTRASSLLQSTPISTSIALLARHELVLGALLGHGGFSNVYAIDWIVLDAAISARLAPNQVRARQDLVRSLTTNKQQYALKQLKQTTVGNNTNTNSKVTHAQAQRAAHAAADLAVEAAFLSRVHHDHVMHVRALPWNAYEAVGDPGGYFIVMDRVEKTLEDKLQEWRQEQEVCEEEDESLRTTITTASSTNIHNRLEIAIQLADALAYLHSHRIVYRDLKPNNVGFLASGQLQLLDFGLVRQLPDDNDNSDDNDSNSVFVMSGVGTRRYMSPEMMEGLYNCKADVYSWSLVVWELLALERPFASYSVEEHRARICHDKERPVLKRAEFGESVCNLLEACWTEHVQDRLDMKEAKALLTSIVRSREYLACLTEQDDEIVDYSATPTTATTTQHRNNQKSASSVKEQDAYAYHSTPIKYALPRLTKNNPITPALSIVSTQSMSFSKNSSSSSDHDDGLYDTTWLVRPVASSSSSTASLTKDNRSAAVWSKSDTAQQSTSLGREHTTRIPSPSPLQRHTMTC